MKTIVYAHPYTGSLNHGILEKLTTSFQAKHEDYQVIDLHKDQFNPAYSPEELAQFNKGTTPYDLTKKYQEMLKKTDELIFVFPIWWSTMPAILKGFIDKVMLPGFAYKVDQTGWHGLLTWIHKATVITTSESPQAGFELPIQKQFIETILPQLGISADKTTWEHLSGVGESTPEIRAEFLNRISNN